MQLMRVMLICLELGNNLEESVTRVKLWVELKINNRLCVKALPPSPKARNRLFVLALCL